MASVRPSAIAGSASGTSTLRTICSGVAPIARAASTRPWSTSRIAPSISRAMKGVAATVSGTIAAVVPIEVPAISRVNGMIATTRMMKGVERVALTSAPSTAIDGRRGEQLAALAGREEDAERQAEQRAEAGRDRDHAAACRPVAWTMSRMMFRRHGRAPPLLSSRRFSAPSTAAQLRLARRHRDEQRCRRAGRRSRRSRPARMLTSTPTTALRRLITGAVGVRAGEGDAQHSVVARRRPRRGCGSAR